MFNEYNIDLDGYGVIVDENNKIMVTNNKEFIEKKIFTMDKKQGDLSQTNFKILEHIDKNTKIVKFNGEKYIVTIKPISYASWKLIGIIPYDFIYSSCVQLYKVYVLVCILVIGFSILISMIIHKSITRPINEIINNMNNVNESNIGSKMRITGNDEISFIMKKYNNMSKRMKLLLNAVKVREKEKREVTLRMLQAQINPHFLFNTLGGLRYVAMMNQDNVVANGLEALAKLLRSTILNKDDFISIEDEIENVKNYITIQKIRYGDTFNVRYHIDDGYLLKGTPAMCHIQAQTAHLKGEALFAPNGNWYEGEMKDAVQEGWEWGFTVPPAKEEGDQYVSTMIEEMYIPGNSDNIETAKEFMRFLYSDEMVEAWKTVDNTLLLRSIYWAKNMENDMKEYYVSNINTECAAFTEVGKMAVINNSFDIQITDVYVKGNVVNALTLQPGELIWIDIK